MISINKSIVPAILVKTKVSLGNFGNYYNNSLFNEDHFYILTEIKKTTDRYEHEHDVLVFYDLTEGKFISAYRWLIEKSIKDGVANIVA